MTLSDRLSTPEMREKVAAKLWRAYYPESIAELEDMPECQADFFELADAALACIAAALAEE